MDFKSLIERAIKIFDPIFEKINGGYFAIGVAVIGYVTLAICSILYYAVEPFTIFTHWVSNLGGAWTNWGLNPNGSNIVFSIGMILLTILAVPAIVYLLKILIQGYQEHAWLIPIATISGTVCVVGIVGVAIFNMKTSLTEHAVFATTFFIAGAYMIFFFSLAMIYDSEISNIYGLIGVIFSGSGLMLLLSMIPPLIQSGWNIVGLVGSSSPDLALARFWEWTYVFAIFNWFILIGILALTREE